MSEKISLLLSSLIFYPETTQNLRSVSHIEKAVFSSTIPNKIRSSAKGRCKIGTFFPPYPERGPFLFVTCGVYGLGQGLKANVEQIG